MARGIRPADRFESFVERLDAALNERGGDIGTGLSEVDVDVVDAGDEVVVVADLPGFDQDGISVKTDGNRLRITAEGEEDEEVEEEDYYRRERTHNSVSRTVTLPVGVDSSEADASYEDGVLSVTLTKSGMDGGEEIEIN
jgi:HSP20 family protein